MTVSTRIMTPDEADRGRGRLRYSARNMAMRCGSLAMGEPQIEESVEEQIAVLHGRGHYSVELCGGTHVAPDRVILRWLKIIS